MDAFGKVFRVILALFVSLVFLVMLAAGPVIAEQEGETPPAQDEGGSLPSVSEDPPELEGEGTEAIAEEPPPEESASSEAVEEEDSDTLKAEKEARDKGEKAEKGEKDEKEAAAEKAAQTAGAGGGGEGGVGGAHASEGISVASPDTLVFTGAATATIPIITPPGRGGMAPNLALRYKSYLGNGWAGVGWALDLGAIQRATKHGVSYSTSDYCLVKDGFRTELVPRSDWGTGFYGEKIEEEFVKYYLNPSTNGWEVMAKDGTRYFYGSTPASRQDSAQGIFGWNLDRIEDPNGNYMTISYTKDQGQVYLDRIDYTGTINGLSPTNYVRFNLEARDDAELIFTPNSGVRTAYRLKTIEVVGNGALARAYKLAYTTSASTQRSLLVSVQQYGADAVITTSGDITSGTVLPPITMGWEQEKAHSFVSQDPFVTEGVVGWDSPLYWAYGDFNGDGAIDIIYHTKATYGRQIVKFSKGDGTFIDGPPVYTYDSSGFTYWAYHDFNGDGMIDIIYRTTTGAGRIKFSNGDGTFIDGPTFTTADAYSWACPTYWAYGDFNGDGKTDICYHTKTANTKRIILSNGDGTFTAGTTLTITNSTGWDSPVYWAYGDFNGDGKTDIFYRTTTAYVNRVLFSNGDGTFTAGPTFTVTDAQSWYSPEYWTYGDFNGDGKTDIIYKTIYGIPVGIFAWRVMFSKGDGTFTSEPLFYLSCTPGMDAAPTYLAYGDFNGDGKTDIIYHTKTANTKQVMVSKGDGTFSAGTTVTRADSAGWDSPAYWAYEDFNGDGRTDICYHTTTANTKKILLSDSGKDLILSMTNSLGGTAIMEYTPSSYYENILLPFVLHPVSTITLDDGFGNKSVTQYEYASGLYDFVDREFRGFGYVKRTRPDNTEVESWFLQDEYRKGRQYQIDLAAPQGGALLARTTLTWQTFPETPPEGTSAFVKLAQERTEYYDAETVFSQGDYTYDNTNGNLLTDTATGTDGERITATYQYQNYGAWLWRQTRQTTTGASTGKTRETQYGYDTRGNLTSLERWLDTGASPETTMTYDTYGNKITEIDPRGNTTAYTYETISHTYPALITLPSTGGTSHVIENEAYDYRFGRVTRAKDENNNRTLYAYDLFGRLSQADYPDGGQRTVAYYDTVFPRYVLAKTKEAEGSTIDLYTYYDGLGREIQKVTFGEGGKAIVSKRHYDFMGRLALVQGPFFGAGPGYPQQPPTAYPWQQTSYDYRGRPVTVTRPDGTYGTAVTSYNYSGFMTTITDPDGVMRTDVRDYLGRIIQVTEHTEAGQQHTLYDYSAAGDLVRIIDAHGNELIMAYDTLGRKINMDDPDMGQWAYTYDLNGNLKTQRDAKNQTITLAYDELNRIISKTYSTSDPAVTFTYDSPSVPNGIGRPASVANASATLAYNAYDPMGRATGVTTTIAGDQARTTGYQYDLAGKPKKTVYPDGYEVTNVYYPGSGLLHTVTGSDAEVYAQCTLYEPTGKIGQISHGNATATRYTYDPYSTRLYGIITADPSGQPQNDIQRRAYSYTRAGDILGITDDLKNITYAYTYDKLHRLLAETNTGAYPQISYSYDAIGNILTKAVGENIYAYTYDPDRPHGVKTVSYTGTAPVDIGPRIISYNAEQMPIRIEQVKAGNTTIVDYLYDGTSTRIKKSVQGGSTTYYVGEHFEVINGVETKYIFAGNLRIAKKTQQGRYYFHKDHLGSSTAMTDATGAKVETTEYVPYGEMREHTGTEVTNYKFTDQELDPETGLYNYGARLYDPVIGRFITPDTIIPDIYDPQMLNRYSYCRNNPLIYVDPNGHGTGGDPDGMGGHSGPGDSPGHGNDSEGDDPSGSDPTSEGNDNSKDGFGVTGSWDNNEGGPLGPDPNKGLPGDPKETEPAKKEKGITSDPKATEPTIDPIRDFRKAELENNQPPPLDFLRIHLAPPTEDDEDLAWDMMVGVICMPENPALGAFLGYVFHELNNARKGKSNDFTGNRSSDNDDNTSNYDHEREGYP